MKLGLNPQVGAVATGSLLFALRSALRVRARDGISISTANGSQKPLGEPWARASSIDTAIPYLARTSTTKRGKQGPEAGNAESPLRAGPCASEAIDKVRKVLRPDRVHRTPARWSRNASTRSTANGRFVDARSLIIEMGLVRVSPCLRPLEGTTASRRRMLTAPTPLFSAPRPGGVDESGLRPAWRDSRGGSASP